MHDHVLVRIEYDWSEKEAVLTIRNEKSEEYKVSYRGVSSISVPHISPWGESSNINSYVEGIEAGLSKATIEVQSGDIIRIIFKDKIITNLYG